MQIFYLKQFPIFFLYHAQLLYLSFSLFWNFLFSEKKKWMRSLYSLIIYYLIEMEKWREFLFVKLPIGNGGVVHISVTPYFLLGKKMLRNVVKYATIRKYYLFLFIITVAINRWATMMNYYCRCNANLVVNIPRSM